MKVALADKPAMPFRVPPGIKLMRVDLKTGVRAQPGDANGHPRSLQAGHRAARRLRRRRRQRCAGARRRAGRDPGSAGRPLLGVSPDADRAIRTGTGGLY